MIADQTVRDVAITPDKSFIIQAPAGSGKTELITQRILCLLATVNAPEEIVAITFTRKAAAEMRHRVLTALARAAQIKSDEIESLPIHEQNTIRLALAVNARDKDLGWNLVAQPTRLRIQTFDAFCADIVKRMPLLSRFGCSPRISEDQQQLYDAAARNTLALVGDEEFGDDIARFLKHFDNRTDYVVKLLAEMLKVRDQWMHKISTITSAQSWSEDMAYVTVHFIAQAAEQLAPRLSELLSALKFAARNLIAETPQHPFGVLLQANDPLLPVTRHNVNTWKIIITSLLTSDLKAFRKPKGVTKAQGFPADKDVEAVQHKKAFQDILESLSSTSPDTFTLACCAPSAIDEVPPLVKSLATVLHVSSGMLWTEFSERGESDYLAIFQGACTALGESDNPSDLALQLDYRIKHLLVDEFQDTNPGQMNLIRVLTSGWSPGDGRTIFIVGDPMQSIYRFRSADVSIFLNVRDHGIHEHLPLEFGRLTCNFRSQHALVEEINEIGPNVLGQKDDAVYSAIAFEPSQAQKTTGAHGCVEYIGIESESYASQEAAMIYETIQRSIANGARSIGVLAQSKRLLLDTAEHLRLNNVPFDAVEIERLSDHEITELIRQLVRAILQPADRLALLCVLRSRIVGATLSDLHALCLNDKDSTLFELFAQRQALLSTDGRARIHGALSVLNRAFECRHSINLNVLVQHVWDRLGAYSVHSKTENNIAEQCFDVVSQLHEHDPRILESLDVMLREKYVSSGAGNPVRLMTIHKSKGLEFDVVILPNVGAATRPEDEPLMRWDVLPLGKRQALTIGFAEGTQSIEGNANTLLKVISKEKRLREKARLLYVAVTRAKQRLYVYANISSTEDWTPSKDSMLAFLWPQRSDRFLASLSKETPISVLPVIGQTPPPELIRASDPIEPLVTQMTHAEVGHEYCADSQPLRTLINSSIGTVTHEILDAYIKCSGVPLHVEQVQKLESVITYKLKALGVPAWALKSSCACVAEALGNTISDKTGAWILRAASNSKSEVSIITVEGKATKTHVIDRVFEDSGYCWIIDYKVVQKYDDEWKRDQLPHYVEQLARYERAMHTLTPLPIKKGLYLPLQKELIVI